MQNYSEIQAWRTLDAAANRAAEGLRVVEDFHRMVENNAPLTQELKALRHRLGQLTAQLDLASRLVARDSRGDVGRESGIASEYTRDDPTQLLAANWARVQQAFRSLEEFLKLVAPHLAPTAESLRFESYTLQKNSLLPRARGDRFPSPCVYVLLDGGPDLATFERRAEALLDAGAGLIQLRDKQLDDRELLARGRCLTELTRHRDAEWIMNDRVDLCLASGARGVHLGQEELPLADARRIVGPNCWIGISTHNLDQARAAAEGGADYLGVGPTFPSQTKSFDSFPGLDFVRTVAAEISIPAFAIGGIDATNVVEVVRAGLARVAVGKGITDAKRPAEALQTMLAEMTAAVVS